MLPIYEKDFKNYDTTQRKILAFGSRRTTEILMILISCNSSLEILNMDLSFSSFHVYVSMECMHACICGMHLSSHVFGSKCVCRPKIDTKTLPWLLPTLFFETGSLNQTQNSSLWSLLASVLCGSSLRLQRLKLQVGHHSYLHLQGFWGIWTLILMSAKQAL